MAFIPRRPPIYTGVVFTTPDYVLPAEAIASAQTELPQPLPGNVIISTTPVVLIQLPSYSELSYARIISTEEPNQSIIQGSVIKTVFGQVNIPPTPTDVIIVSAESPRPEDGRYISLHNTVLNQAVSFAELSKANVVFEEPNLRPEDGRYISLHNTVLTQAASPVAPIILATEIERLRPEDGRVKATSTISIAQAQIAPEILEVISQVEPVRPESGTYISLHGVVLTQAASPAAESAYATSESPAPYPGYVYSAVSLGAQVVVSPIIPAAVITSESPRPESGRYISLHNTVLNQAASPTAPIVFVMTEAPRPEPGFYLSLHNTVLNQAASPVAPIILAIEVERLRPESGRVISAFALWELTNIPPPAPLLASVQGLQLELDKPWGFSTAATPSQVPQTLPGRVSFATEIEELTKLEPKQPKHSPLVPVPPPGGGDGGDKPKYKRPRKDVIIAKKRRKEEELLISLMIHSGLLD